MKILLTVLFTATMATGFSQQPRVWVVPTPAPKKYFRDTLLNDLIKERRNAIDKSKKSEDLRRKSELLQKSQRPADNMPNAMKLPSLPPVYDGNNGWGFDIYRSQVDNMPILMPDSTNASSLKKEKNGTRTYPSIYIQPKLVSPPPKN